MLTHSFLSKKSTSPETKNSVRKYKEVSNLHVDKYFRLINGSSYLSEHINLLKTSIKIIRWYTTLFFKGTFIC